MGQIVGIITRIVDYIRVCLYSSILSPKMLLVNKTAYNNEEMLPFIWMVMIFLLLATGWKREKRGFLRTFLAMVMVNAMMSVYPMLKEIFFHSQEVRQITDYVGILNPLSLLVLVLVVSECYQDRKKGAFFFGMAVFAASVCLRPDFLMEEGIFDAANQAYDKQQVYFLFYCLWALGAAVICALGTTRRYSFVSYWVMAIFSVLVTTVRTWTMDIVEWSDSTPVYLTLERIMRCDFHDIMAGFMANSQDFFIFLVIALFLTFFELCLVRDEKLGIRDLGLKKAAAGLVVAGLVAGSIFGTFALLAKDYGIPLGGWPEDFVEETAEKGKPQENGETSYEKVVPDFTEATSALTSKSGIYYGPENTIDGFLDTCWQDGNGGDNEDGVNEVLSYGFNKPVELKRIHIVNGNVLSENKYQENNRLQMVKIELFLEGELMDGYSMVFQDEYNRDGETVEMPSSITCDRAEITVADVYTGSRYHDLCVAEVEFEKLK